jgi:hypothetical protein
MITYFGSKSLKIENFTFVYMISMTGNALSNIVVTSNNELFCITAVSG